MKILLLSTLLVFFSGVRAFAQDSTAVDTLFYPVKHLGSWYFIDSSGTVHEEKPHYDFVTRCVFSRKRITCPGKTESTAFAGKTFSHLKRKFMIRSLRIHITSH